MHYDIHTDRMQMVSLLNELCYVASSNDSSNDASTRQPSQMSHHTSGIHAASVQPFHMANNIILLFNHTHCKHMDTLQSG